MVWWQQPLFQEALPIMIAIIVGTRYQRRKIDRVCQSIDTWIAENDTRAKTDRLRHERAAARSPANRYN